MNTQITQNSEAGQPGSLTVAHTKTNKNTLSLLKDITMVKHIKIHLTHTKHY